MLSVLPKASHLPAARLQNDYHHDLHLHELGSAHETVEQFSKLLGSSGQAIRLHCTVPTWCPEGETCLDLHDLNELQARSMVFIHNLVETLRASGVRVSYRLAPTSCSACIVCALPPDLDPALVKHDAVEAVLHTKFDVRKKVMLADLKFGPALIIT